MTNSNPDRATVDVHLSADDVVEALRVDVAAGLTASPKELPPKWFYDEEGSRLFDEITCLEEYYPTEAERRLLLDNAVDIIELTRPTTVVELGSGTSDKTAALLDAAVTTDRLNRFVPFDVSEEFLRTSVEALAERYPTIQVHGVVGDFDHHLGKLPTGGRQLTLFLGGTIGNYRPLGRAELLRGIAERSAPDDHVLIGVDLVKDVGRVELAYDDPQGVTAAFNKNVLAVVNAQLGADFNLDAFDHVARFESDNEWIEMLLRSRKDQQVAVADLGLTVAFAADELMRTEVSCKFRKEGFEAELRAAGLQPLEWLTDGDYAVSISRR